MHKRPTSSKVLILLLAVLGLKLTTPVLGQEPAGQKPSTKPSDDVVLTFPPGRPIAKLLCRAELVEQFGESGPAVRRVLASGRVVLPRDCWIEIYLNDNALGNMQYLDQLKDLHVYNFSASGLDFEDNDLTHIKGYRDLRSLNVESTMVSDKSLPLIGSFKNLLYLRLNGTEVTGSGFGSLKNLKHLRYLDLAGTKMTPGNVQILKALAPTVSWLNLAQTGLSQVDANIISDMPQVQTLNLAGNNLINDNVNSYFAGLKNLRDLDIHDSHISDKVLTVLTKLPQLRKVTVRSRAFWKASWARKQIGHLTIINCEDEGRVPADIFEPVH